jgi:hypothetical protein
MQDYAQELFNISRSKKGNKTAVIEKLWAGDVAKYITELESTINIQKRKLANLMVEDVLRTSDEDILQEVFEEYGNEDFIANKMKSIIESAKNTEQDNIRDVTKKEEA